MKIMKVFFEKTNGLFKLIIGISFKTNRKTKITFSIFEFHIGNFKFPISFLRFSKH